MNQNHKKISPFFSNLILAGVSLFVVAVTCEIALRMFYPQNLNASKMDTLYGFSGEPNIRVHHRTQEFHSITTTNSKGLRDIEHEYAKKPGVFRILFLGDSFTFGWGVNDQESFPAVLREILQKEPERKIEIINSAWFGWDTEKELVYLRNEGLKYQPDLIILGFCIANDHEENLEGKLVTFSGNQATYHEHPYLFSWWDRLKCFFSAHFHLYKLASKTVYILKNEPTAHTKRGIRTFSKENPERIKMAWEKTFLIFDELDKLLKKEKIPLLVLLIPVREQVSPEYFEIVKKEAKAPLTQDDLVESQRILSTYLRSKNMAYLDLLPEMKMHDQHNSFFYGHDGHFNPKGHQEAAALLYQNLKEHNFYVR